MGRKRGNKTKQARIGSMVPDALFYDQRFLELSTKARELLYEALQMNDSYNNGNLALTMNTLHLKWNHHSLAKAIKELRENGFIHLEREGYYGKPNLYSLTFYAVNESKFHGIEAHKQRWNPDGVRPKNGQRIKPIRGRNLGKKN